MDSQQTRVILNRRGSKLYRWRIDKLEVKEKQQEEFQQVMAKSTAQFSKLLESTGTTKNDVEQDSAEARIIEGWEQWSRTTASKAIGKKLILCHDRAVKGWDKGVKEATRYVLRRAVVIRTHDGPKNPYIPLFFTHHIRS